jgi:VanZ family protein
MRPSHWAPPVLWMAVILALSTEAGGAPQTGRVLLPILATLLPGASPLQLEAIHGGLRKGAHVAEYAVLAALWFRALAGAGWRRRPAGLAALALGTAWAIVDEAVQTRMSSRTGSPADVVLDTAGALAAVTAAVAGWRRCLDVLTDGLLLVAAVGGLLFLGVSVWLDLPSGWLGLTTPAALLAWILRRRGRRRPPAAAARIRS